MTPFRRFTAVSLVSAAALVLSPLLPVSGLSQAFAQHSGGGHEGGSGKGKGPDPNCAYQDGSGRGGYGPGVRGGGGGHGSGSSGGGHSGGSGGHDDGGHDEGGHEEGGHTDSQTAATTSRDPGIAGGGGSGEGFICDSPGSWGVDNKILRR